MTEMRRITISIPADIDRKILDLRKDDQFVRCSYADILRQMLRIGIKDYEQNHKEV